MSHGTGLSHRGADRPVSPSTCRHTERSFACGSVGSVSVSLRFYSRDVSHVLLRSLLFVLAVVTRRCME